MDYKLGEKIKEGKAEGIPEIEYALLYIPADWWFKTTIADCKYICAKQGVDTVYFEEKKPIYDDMLSLVDNYGIARFQSLESLIAWLNGETVTVVVGSGNHLTRIPGIDYQMLYRLPKPDPKRTYVELRYYNGRRIIRKLNPILEKEQEEGTGRKLKPKNK